MLIGPVHIGCLRIIAPNVENFGENGPFVGSKRGFKKRGGRGEWKKKKKTGVKNLATPSDALR